MAVRDQGYLFRVITYQRVCIRKQGIKRLFLPERQSPNVFTRTLRSYCIEIIQRWCSQDVEDDR